MQRSVLDIAIRGDVETLAQKIRRRQARRRVEEEMILAHTQGVSYLSMVQLIERLMFEERGR